MAYYYSSLKSWYITDCASASSKSTCIFGNSSSFLFYSSRIDGTPIKKRRFVVLSLDQTTPSSNSSSSGCFKVKKSPDKELLSVDGSFSLLEDVDEPNWKDKKWVSRIGADGKKKRRKEKKKKPLWRRMLFVSNKVKSIILLNVITVVYASNISVVKEAEAVMDPATFSAVRFVMSAIPFLPFVYRARDDVEIRNAGMELGLWVSLGYLVEALGLLTSDAGRASFISLFTVIVVPLLDGMLGAIIPARTWLGVFMSVVGVGMLECSGSPPNVGDLLNFLSATFFGIHMLRTEHISRNTKKENFLALLGYEVSVAALFSTIWYLIGGWFDGVQDLEQSPWTWTWDSIVAFPWIPAIYTGIFSTGLCLWVEIAAMRDVSATETAIIYGLEPIWGAGFAWFLLGERWGTMGWIGAALVLGGSLTVQIYGSSPSNEDLSSKGSNKSIDILSIADKKNRNNSLSASPIVVRSNEDIKRMAK